MPGETGLLKTGNLSQQLERVDIKKLFTDCRILAPTDSMKVIIVGLLGEMRDNPNLDSHDFAAFDRQRINPLFVDTSSSQLSQVYTVISHIFWAWDIPMPRKASLQRSIPKVQQSLPSPLRSMSSHYHFRTRSQP